MDGWMDGMNATNLLLPSMLRLCVFVFRVGLLHSEHYFMQQQQGPATNSLLFKTNKTKSNPILSINRNDEA